MSRIRASQLAKEALELVDAGQFEAGARAIREAASLDPENEDVKAAFKRIEEDQSVHPLLRACRNLAHNHDQDAAKYAAHYLSQRDAQVPPEVGDECTRLLFEVESRSEPLEGDKILSGLLRHSFGARRYFAERLKNVSTKNFEFLWGIGDDSVNALVAVTQDQSAWTSPSARERCEVDIFQLLLAKIMEPGNDRQSTAMKGLARMLATDSEKLYRYIDSDSFDTVLSCLDYRLPVELRSQATLVAAKYLEESKETGQSVLANFITEHFATQEKEDVILSFSAAAAVFPIAPGTAAALFLTEGFVESLVPLIRRKTKSPSVEYATLEMLSAACMNQACRDAIAKHCSQWLEELVEKGDGKNSGLAAVILAKIRGSENTKATSDQKIDEAGTDVQDLVSRFKGMMSEDDNRTRESALEGLAYSSMKPKVKEQIAHDEGFLGGLIKTMKDSAEKSTVVFGGLSILANITAYVPRLSDEQKSLSQLKAYANTSKLDSKPDPLDSDERVTARCKAVLQAGTVTYLVNNYKKMSPQAFALVLNILLALSKEQKHRGPIAQQGGVKLLLQVHSTLSGDPKIDIQSRRTAAHALARILISVNPSLVFGSASGVSINSAVSPLLDLLKDDPTTDQRDLLPIFEGLLALTNVASADEPPREAIIRQAWPKIEDLLLSNNNMVQRAAVELICNLMASPQGVAKLADGSPQATNRLHILTALADAEDRETRRAAGGALAMLTEWDAAVEAVVKRERGVKIILGLCEEDDDELRHRGVVCICNIVCAPGKAGETGKAKVKEEGGVEILKQVSSRARNPAILEPLLQALRVLLG